MHQYNIGGLASYQYLVLLFVRLADFIFSYVITFSSLFSSDSVPSRTVECSCRLRVEN